MITPRESPPREILERIATDFRRRGYEVLIEPRGDDLPSFLRDATPDLIARSRNENLVIEVRRSPDAVDPSQLAASSERVAKEPGWRFVLLASDPSESRPARLDALTERDVAARLKEVHELLETNHFDAAMMLAWAATEALLRLMVIRNRLTVSRDDPAALIRALASEGAIDENAFRQLNQAFSYRSALAHGRTPPANNVREDTRNLTQALSRLSEALLKELPAPAA